MQFQVFQLCTLSSPAAKTWFVRIGTIASLTVLVLNGNPLTANGQTPDNSNPPSTQTPPQPATVQTQAGAKPILRLGSEGESVSELQAMLKLLGYYSGAVDGIYRASTAAAVSSFQQAIGLQADGVVGPETWNRLLPPSPPASSTASVPPAPSPTPAPAPTPAPSPAPAPSPTPAPAPTPQPNNSQTTSVDLPVLRLGMRGPAVSRLQERLRALGFYSGAVDGIFGAETQSAVQAAQREFDLEPDGVVGSATWTALLQ